MRGIFLAPVVSLAPHCDNCVWILPTELGPDSAPSMEMMTQTHTTSRLQDRRVELVSNKDG